MNAALAQVPAPPQPDAAQCPRHGKVALAPCERCGTFRCEDCGAGAIAVTVLGVLMWGLVLVGLMPADSPVD